jgi:hypothetical protein
VYFLVLLFSGSLHFPPHRSQGVQVDDDVAEHHGE